MPLASLVALKKLNANNNAPRFARRLKKTKRKQYCPSLRSSPEKNQTQTIMPLASLVALKKLNANNNAHRFARRLKKTERKQ